MKLQPGTVQAGHTYAGSLEKENVGADAERLGLLNSKIAGR